MAAEAVAANLQLNGGASTSTGSFTMSSGLGLLIDEEFHIYKVVPIIVMGDFNVDVKRNEKAFGFMKKRFDLNMVPTNYPITLGNYILIQLLQETLGRIIKLCTLLFISSIDPTQNCNISTDY
ncbi:hypothetical protein AVEN_261586-1 [Araneus ventricosus]|uniref:Uncharacterized protein n=1 Tax=Araneus ventricosus TaxID=182803 RepID=A0A4Y2ECA4_ARAVE|nr:hypothetical protein AVEN_261586-1 [Araneus ventricosus]